MSNESSHVIVLGFPRSGTTLLRQILAAHPDISCPPEPWLTTSCAKFIREVPANGPGIGVLSGLGFSGVDDEEVLEPLRQLFRNLHRRMANGRRVCVEKSGFDIFYLQEIEQLFGRDCKFICLVRNPLDVISSVKALTDEMGRYMPELHPYVQSNASPLEAFSQAWAEKSAELLDFMTRHQETCFSYRFEDLLEKPRSVLDPLMDFLEVPKLAEDTLNSTFNGDISIGLGDWKVYEKRGLDATTMNQWRKKIPRDTLAKVLPLLEDGMHAYGYDVPRPPKLADRKKSVQQFKTIMTMRRSGVLKD